MSNLTRWEPMREIVTLREAMDHLFDDAFTHPFGMTDGRHTSSIPAIDMYQTDNEVVIKASLPGVKTEDVQINMTGDLLTIKGEMKQADKSKTKNYHIHEQRLGAFERRVQLPILVVSDKARAEFENGVLTVTLPKAEEVKPKMITIIAR